MIEVDEARGVVVLGTVCVPLERAGTAFRLPDGATVRMATFGERSWAAREALAGGELAEILRTFAMEGESNLLGDAVMLALAGGGEEAPPFEICAVEAARIHGWSWKALNDAPAIEVDRALVGPQEDGWKRFVFGAEELEELVKEMTERLLERAIGAKEPTEASEARAQRRREDGWTDAVAVEPETWRASAAGVARRMTERVRDSPPPVVGPANLATTVPRQVRTIESQVSSAPDWGGNELAQVRDVARRIGNAPSQVASAPRGADSQPGASKLVSAHGPAPAATPSAKTSPGAGTTAGATIVLPRDFVSSQVRVSPWQASSVPGQGGFPETRSSEPARQISRSPSRDAGGQPPTDWLEEIARSLAAECDLRGLDA